jgi:ribosome-associated translation inhibitor RaiA
MKRFGLLFFAALIMPLWVNLADADGHQDSEFSVRGLNKWHMDGVKYEIDDGSIFISHHGLRHDRVEITEEGQVYINDELVKLDREQQGLVATYYDLTTDIVSQAKNVGQEGARIGMEGAKLALKAVVGVVKMVFTSYDGDDLDQDVEWKAEKLERRAKRLEEKAEDIKELAEDLERIAEEMNETIPELRELGWFYR